MKSITNIFLVLVCSVIIGICGCKKDTTVPLLSATTITDSNYDGLNSNYMYKIYATGRCTITNDGEHQYHRAVPAGVLLPIQQY